MLPTLLHFNFGKEFRLFLVFRSILLCSGGICSTMTSVWNVLAAIQNQITTTTTTPSTTKKKKKKAKVTVTCSDIVHKCRNRHHFHNNEAYEASFPRYDIFEKDSIWCIRFASHEERHNEIYILLINFDTVTFPHNRFFLLLFFLWFSVVVPRNRRYACVSGDFVVFSDVMHASEQHLHFSSAQNV